MSKITLITTSEYLRRLRSKGFIIATLLAPVLLVGVLGVAVGVGYLTHEAAHRTVAILDHTGQLGPELAVALPERYDAVVTDAPEDTLRAHVRRGALDGYLVLPVGLLDGTQDATFISDRGEGLTGDVLLRQVLTNVVREARLRRLGAGEEVFAVLDQRVGLRTVVLTDVGEAADASFIYSGLGYVMGFIIYMAIFISGAMVLRGVIEEKSNRIVEVIASSASPFELLMGKVLGIGAAGLTQLVLWGLLLMLSFAFLGPMLLAVMSPELAAAPEAEMALDLGAFGVSPLLLFLYFILYFLGGYLVYASFFAAIGSAVESEADAQSLQVPVTIPAILPIVILPLIADNPEAPLSVVLSLVPLFSPILMPVRIAAGAAAGWEIVASLALLGAAFVGAIWLAARIYRVGILMYGKKASFRDLARWARHA